MKTPKKWVIIFVLITISMTLITLMDPIHTQEYYKARDIFPINISCYILGNK